MTLTLTLAPQVEGALASKASEAGLDIDHYVEEVLTREFAPKWTPMTESEVKEYLDELRRLSSSAKGLADPNFTRETIYQDRD